MIEILFGILLPASALPIILGIVGTLVDISADNFEVNSLAGFSEAFEVTATFTTIALSTVFVIYICVAAAVDRFCENIFLPGHLYVPSAGASGFYFLGNKRTVTERAAVREYCASYIFRRSVFRRHAYVASFWKPLLH